MTTKTEVKKMKYSILQAFAKELEDSKGIGIDRNIKKELLLAEVLKAMDLDDKPSEDESVDEETNDEVDEEVAEAVDKIIDEVESDVDLYVATKIYKDWESGWEFNPSNPDMNKPIPIDNMTSGLENAIAKGVVVRFDGVTEAEPNANPEDEE